MKKLTILKFSNVKNKYLIDSIWIRDIYLKYRIRGDCEE